MSPTQPQTAMDPKEPIPEAIIAQADAAIAANTQDDAPDLPELERRPSKLHQPLARSSTLPAGRQPNEVFGHEYYADSPPAYITNEVASATDKLGADAQVTDDGRVNININQRTRKLSEILVPALRNQLDSAREESQAPLPPGYIPPALGGLPGQTPPPRLNVVIHVVGSRGDVQPFVALGMVLKSTYGHRVRLATHAVFQELVESMGLEFFSIGGNPEELMTFMVKNPGLMPGMETIKSGEIGKRRRTIEEILMGCWRSCVESGNGLNTPDASQVFLETNASDEPFIADAIIANPPSFAHIHIAEKMGIPLHMIFTMPWTATQSFPHPLADIKSSNVDAHMANFLSYTLVEMMTWQGLGDVINRFRERALGLDPISTFWAPGLLTRLRVPFTYCWSPALIPKPKDWGRFIDISGFFFLNLASTYTPDPDIAAFLAAGPPPVYIGFGSIPIEDPNTWTKMIFDAVKKAGVRALVSKGWGGLGGDSLEVPENIFMLGNVPHDWLFQHVSCVVHHGGAGTTAAGITAGKPTIVVPFFGDQPFWGAMIARAGAGPPPIHSKQLTADKLAEAIKEALKPSMLEKAKELASKIAQEKGTDVAAKSFNDHLDVDKMRCSLSPSRVATWRLRRTRTLFSPLAATVLANEGLISFAELKLFRAREYECDTGPLEPITGATTAIVGTLSDLGAGVVDLPLGAFKALHKKNKQRPDAHAKSNSGASDSELRTSTESDERSGSGADPAEYALIHANTSPAKHKQHFSRSSTSMSKQESHKNERQSSPTHPPLDMEMLAESASATGKGVVRIVRAGVKSPMDFTLSLARGFHNAPKLYGDDTVREPDKVTGLGSGLKAAGKGFGYGMYDGITGLVTQPLRGAEKEGAAGLFKGFAKGLAGITLKPVAAFWALPGYTMQGIHKEISRRHGSTVVNYIISARTAEGYAQYNSATPEERAEIIQRWHEHKIELQSEHQRLLEMGPEGQNKGRLTGKGVWESRHLTFDERRKQYLERKAMRSASNKGLSPADSSSTLDGVHEPSGPVAVDRAINLPLGNGAGAAMRHVDTSDLEQAINASVSACSQGDAEQDRFIERALRASMTEWRRAQESGQVSEEQAYEIAVRASIAEAERLKSGNGQQPDDPEYNKALKLSLQQSLSEFSQSSAHDSKTADQTSTATATGSGHDSDDDEDLRLAIQASQSTHAEEMGRGKQTWPDEKKQSEKERSDEEVVLEYVKKQSLAEAEHKASLGKRGSSAGADGAAEDDELDIDLKYALEVSKWMAQKD